MAEVIIHLDKKQKTLAFYELLQSLHFIFAVICTVILFLMPALRQYFYDMYVFVAFSVLFGLFFSFNLGCYFILSKKAKGLHIEDSDSSKMLAELKKLPDEYLVINNLRIKNGSEVMRVDYLVIAKNNLYLLEARSFPGAIYGKEQSPHWIQNYKSQNDIIENKIANPVLSCKRLLRAVKKYILLVTGKEYEVLPVVVITDARNVLNLDVTTPVLRYNQLVNYILDNENKMRHLSAS